MVYCGFAASWLAGAACAYALDAAPTVRQSATMTASTAGPATLHVRFIPFLLAQTPIVKYARTPRSTCWVLRWFGKLWDYRKSLRKSARRYSAGTYVVYIVESCLVSLRNSAPKAVPALNVKMSFARKWSPE